MKKVSVVDTTSELDGRGNVVNAKTIFGVTS